MHLGKVCDILIKAGFMTDEQKQTAMKKEEIQKRRIIQADPFYNAPGQRGKLRYEIGPTQIIASLKFTTANQPERILTEDLIMEKVAAHYGFQYHKIDPIKIDQSLIASTLSRPFARRHSVLPLIVSNGILTVAISNPDDKVLLDQLARISGMKVNPVLSSITDIQKIITEVYGFSTSVQAAEAQMSMGIDLGNLEQYVKLKKVDEIEADDRHIVNAVEYILRYAFDQRASDVHIEPKRNYSLVRFRIDGVMHNIYNMPKVVHTAMISRIKTMSRLDIAERRRPQDGRIKTELGQKEVEIRISTVPVAFGEKVVMRIFDPEMMAVDLDGLGFFEEDLKKWDRFISNPYGLILVTGPTGSGKTTTLYSTLQAINTSEVNICTIEDPIEMIIEDMNQMAIQPKIGITFSSALRNILRQDPDIIMVGEIRDRETASYGMQAAMTGHLVFSTLHTNDTASSVVRLFDLGIEPFQVASTLLGVLAQRLMRKVCPDCRKETTLTPDQIEMLKLGYHPDELKSLKVYQGTGCSLCRSTGLYGRTGIFEVLEVSDTVRKLVIQKAPARELEKAGVADGMFTLRDLAIKKLARGGTSYSEVIRVTSQEEL
ncbi:MAG: ATPase, T2SS/T4P/T4SS family [Pseudomonadota bacterium]